MALDGLVIANAVFEFNSILAGGRINKIAQPENDELVLTIKSGREQYKLLLSAGASLPLAYLTNEAKPNPMTAPNFCMLLRKHLSSAKIIRITQPGLERIIDIEIEHLNELGDACIKHLIVELMGKHSNIIFCDDNSMIIDSIKHISNMVSSVREVLPGRTYFIPSTMHKKDPLQITYPQFEEAVLSKAAPLSKAVYSSLTGISPLIANELCTRACIDSDKPCQTLTENEKLHLFKTLEHFIEDIKDHCFRPNIIYENNIPVEFSSTKLTCYLDKQEKCYDTISEVLENYYAAKDAITRMRQKSSDLRRIVNTALERTQKKYDLQLKQLKDTKKRDKYKVYGELITTYGYDLEEGVKSLTALNYYTDEEITIPLDPNKTPMENANKYFDRYNKLKRTYEALILQTEETKEELMHLESISNSLEIAGNENDLAQLKEELTAYGYIKRKNIQNKKKKSGKLINKPLHYISSDGFHIYVGKNNYQNDDLTFQFASGNDWWFHAKGMAGSHVIVKTDGAELPDRTFEEAGRLAGYYSRAKGTDKAEIDYTLKKNVKKPNGGKPGFVVYYTNYSLVVPPDITGLQQIE